MHRIRETSSQPTASACFTLRSVRELRRLGVFPESDAAGVDQLRVAGVDQLRVDLLMWVAKSGETVCFGLTIEQWVNLETDETLAEYTKRMQLPYQWGGVL